ncbi:MAG: VWA domain-containing protein [Pseudomonadota bacterium]
MLRRSREISIFSTSALDLFASGMGAFVLIAVVMMPYFPNTGDSPERIQEVKAALASAEETIEDQSAQIDDLRGQAETLQKAKEKLEKDLEAERNKPTVAFPPLDIVILLDTSGSMDRQVSGLRTEISQLTQLLLRLTPSLGVGIVDFNDRCLGAPRPFNLRLMQGAAIGELQAFVRTMRARGVACNTDSPEDAFRALNLATQMAWRSAARVKSIVLITDNPAYPEQLNAAYASASQFAARGRGHRVSAVFVPTSNQAMGEPFLKEIARRGGGEFVVGGGSMTATILLALAGT